MKTDLRISRYESARQAMAQHSVPIPPSTLEGYLQALREASRQRTGPMYAKRLVITGDWLRPGKLARALFESAINEGYVIDTQGQEWNRV